jgi:PAS domain S-box-containing protein
VLDDRWVARRDAADERIAQGGWWANSSLPSVRYDAQGLIVAANDAAEALLGRAMVGHHWQEFVTPGSTEEVAAMLAILSEAGRAESKFRMPRADGTLIEFDSYTEVVEDSFTTVMRPRMAPD